MYTLNLPEDAPDYDECDFLRELLQICHDCVLVDVSVTWEYEVLTQFDSVYEVLTQFDSAPDIPAGTQLIIPRNIIRGALYVDEVLILSMSALITTVNGVALANNIASYKYLWGHQPKHNSDVYMEKLNEFLMKWCGGTVE